MTFFIGYSRLDDDSITLADTMTPFEADSIEDVIHWITFCNGFNKNDEEFLLKSIQEGAVDKCQIFPLELTIMPKDKFFGWR